MDWTWRIGVLEAFSISTPACRHRSSAESASKRPAAVHLASNDEKFAHSLQRLLIVSAVLSSLPESSSPTTKLC